MHIDTINLKDALKDTCALFREYPHVKKLPQMDVQFTEACKAITGNAVEHPALSLIRIYNRIFKAVT